MPLQKCQHCKERDVSRAGGKFCSTRCAGLDKRRDAGEYDPSKARRNRRDPRRYARWMLEQLKPSFNDDGTMEFERYIKACEAIFDEAYERGYTAGFMGGSRRAVEPRKVNVSDSTV